MIILFHSEECKFCVKLLEYINNNNLNDFFKFINIDTLEVIPEHITIVPTVIDSSIEAPLEGKKAFEYVVNHKYFNHPTNNVDFWIKTPLPKPTIEEDKRALDKTVITFYTNLDDANKNAIVKPQLDNNIKKQVKQVYYKSVTKPTISPIVKKPIIAKNNIVNSNNKTDSNDKSDSNDKTDSNDKPESNDKSDSNDNIKTNNQTLINNNLKKNMALMRLRR